MKKTKIPIGVRGVGPQGSAWVFRAVRSVRKEVVKDRIRESRPGAPAALGAGQPGRMPLSPPPHFHLGRLFHIHSRAEKPEEEVFG